MWQWKSYTVLVWRGGDRGDAVLGIVEELGEEQEPTCETLEEFLLALRAQRGRRPHRMRTFADFEGLRRILESSFTAGGTAEAR